MEGRYKSLAAMDASPWIAHFTKTAGDTEILSSKPKPVVVDKKYSEKDKSKGSGGKQTSGTSDSMPLTIVSPVGQSTEMAQADLNMERDKNTDIGPPASLGGPTLVRSQGASRKPSTQAGSQSQAQRGRKRKLTHRTGANKAGTGKSIARIRDIFT